MEAKQKFTYTKFFPLPHSNPAKWSKQKGILEEIATKKITNLAMFEEKMITLIKLATLVEGADIPIHIPTIKSFTSYPPETQAHYLNELFPYIATLALALETEFPEGHLPFLETNNMNCVVFPRKQVASIIAGCFYCILVAPVLGFDMLDCSFIGFYSTSSANAFRKLMFYLLYFDTIRTQPNLNSDISVTRISLSEEKYKELNAEFWSKSVAVLKEVIHNPKGKIEDSPEAIQVDFADPYIGGGVDATGDQEQIIFLIYPELHVSYVLCEKMFRNEAILISGFQRYGSYAGYGGHIEFKGYCGDILKDKRDANNRIPRHVIGIDAIPMPCLKLQLENKVLLQDINKAYIGYMGDCILGKGESLPISTGKWGCGAFCGNPQLKLLLQWMAASQNGRDMIYYSFGDSAYKFLEDLVKFWKGKTVGELFLAVQNCAKKIDSSPNLFKFLLPPA